jgi:hypothetical protein
VLQSHGSLTHRQCPDEIQTVSGCKEIIMSSESRASGAVHPDSNSLALYSTRDLPWISRMAIRHHVSGCLECERQVSRFRSSLVELKRKAANEGLPEIDWIRLEREMLGNIAVGVAAARCIDNVGRRRLFSRGFVVTAGLAVLFVAGWYTHIPTEQNVHLVDSLRRIVGMRTDSVLARTVLRTTPEGIAVRDHGVTLTLLHPGSAVVSLSGNSTVTARYVDASTGQVTIAKVYGE